MYKLKRLNVWFFLSFFASLSSFLLYQLPEFFLAYENYPDHFFLPSALKFTLEPICFGGYILLFPIFSSISCVVTVTREIKSSLLLWNVQKIGCVKTYVFQNLLQTSIISGLSVSLSFMVYALICNFFFHPSNPMINPNHLLPFSETIYAYMYGVLGGFPMYLYLAFAIFFVGFCWGAINYVFCVATEDPILSLMIVFGLHLIWLWGGLKSLSPILAVDPTALYNDGLTYTTMLVSLLQYFSLYIICLVAGNIFIRKKVHE